MYLKDRIVKGETNQLSQLEREIYKKVITRNKRDVHRTHTDYTWRV